MTTKLFVRTALAIALAGTYAGAPAAFAQTTASVASVSHKVQDWRTEAVSATTSRFVITLDKPLSAVPANFRGPGGSYVAIDLPSTAMASGVKTVSADKDAPHVTGTRWAESNKRSRLVLNTVKGTTHVVTLEGNDVIVTLKSEKADVTPAPTTSVAAGVVAAPATNSYAVITPAATEAKPVRAVLPDAPAGALLRDVDYKKTGVANGVLTLDLSDPSVKVRVYREGTNLIVDLPNTTLPRNLAKRTRIEQLDTPVLAISPSSSRDGATRLLLEARGGWDYTFAQNGSTITINIIKISDDYRVGGKKVFTGEKMEFSFQNVEVRTLLQVLAVHTGLNVVVSDSVTGSITLHLKDVPWDHALDVVLSTKNLDMRRTGNVITVAPKEEMMKKEKQDRDERLAAEAAEPTITETFQINYHSAEDIKKLLEAGSASTTSGGASSNGSEGRVPPIKLRADKRTNQLFATGTPAQLDDTRDVIRSVDVAGRQVAIEAKIIEVSDSFAKNIGVKFGFNNGGSRLGRLGDINGTIGSTIPTNVSGVTGGLADMSDLPMSVSLPAASINGANPGTFAFTLFNKGLTRFLNLEVSALEADGKAKTVSSPRVVTADNEEATIKQGTEIPYQQASSSGATTISFKTAAMVLKVTPQITPNGKVSLKLDVNKDSVGQNTTSGPAIDTKAISTKVLVDNGGTIVIGGIFITDEVGTENKVPLLGDLPVVGNAFKNNGKTTTKKELIIMVTPRVIDSSGSTGPAQ